MGTPKLKVMNLSDENDAKVEHSGGILRVICYLVGHNTMVWGEHDDVYVCQRCGAVKTWSASALDVEEFIGDKNAE